MKTTNLKQTLARLTMIVVLACATTFAVKAQNIDYKKIAKMPGVEYTYTDVEFEAGFILGFGTDEKQNTFLDEITEFREMHGIETENRSSIRKILDIFKDIINGKDKKAKLLLKTIDEDEEVIIIKYTEDAKKGLYTIYIISHEKEDRDDEELSILAIKGKFKDKRTK